MNAKNKAVHPLPENGRPKESDAERRTPDASRESMRLEVAAFHAGRQTVETVLGR
jgi:hypothetical protein